MFDFLNETTYGNDDLANGDMINTIMSMASQPDTDPGEQLDEDSHEHTDGDLIEMAAGAAQDNEQEEESNPTEQENDGDDDDSDGMIDPQIMAFLFDEQPDDGQGSSMRNMRNSVDVPNIPTGLSWLKTKTNNVNLSGTNERISKYLNTLPENLRKALVATSGNDDKHATNSKHYSGEAVDLRFNKEAYNYMMSDPAFKQMGLNMLPPEHGTAPHLHIETKQFGGAVASTAQQKYVGLNNPQHNEMFFPMKGANTFRGLDNNQPVAITDGKKYKVLVGKNDTATFKGNVYEKRL